MKYWMFTVTPQKEDAVEYGPEDILTQRVKDKFWGLGEKTPNRRALEPGDKIVFYLGNPHKSFAGTATLGSASFALSSAQQDELAHGTQLFRAPHGVRLEGPVIWEHPRRVEDLISSLDFIENKVFWYSHFQGGVRQLGERDFQTICNGVIPATRPDGIVLPAMKAEEAEFALEAHLEEFIDKNWSAIQFDGRKLKRYATEEQNGRQFPAGLWNIDFLCVDEKTRSLVVVELKRGKTSDATVGQILRYMSWVKENVAEKDQEVEGIIVAREVDDALRYAVKNQQIEVLVYKVNFSLSKPTQSRELSSHADA
ncbi:MAG: hypothetical protein JWN74_496 [Acidobacteriaceae bacterium]|nr:hypothetical protein [Acidobacteriaceae bacterium]